MQTSTRSPFAQVGLVGKVTQRWLENNVPEDLSNR